MVDEKTLKKHTPLPWGVMPVARTTIAEVVAGLCKQDSAFVLHGKLDGLRGPIIAIFPTKTRKPTKEELANISIISSAVTLQERMHSIIEHHPEIWEEFITKVKAAQSSDPEETNQK